MSEEFRCTPDVAINLPFGLSQRIMSLRNYAQARAQVESTEKPEDLQMNASIAQVLEIQAEIAMEAMAARREEV